MPIPVSKSNIAVVSVCSEAISDKGKLSLKVIQRSSHDLVRFHKVTGYSMVLVYSTVPVLQNILLVIAKKLGKVFIAEYSDVDEFNLLIPASMSKGIISYLLTWYLNRISRLKGIDTRFVSLDLTTLTKKTGVHRAIGPLIHQFYAGEFDNHSTLLNLRDAFERIIVEEHEPENILEREALTLLLHNGFNAIVVHTGAPVFDTALRLERGVTERDVLASTLAISLNAQLLIFYTHVEGLRTKNGIIKKITLENIKRMLNSGDGKLVVFGGMRRKLLVAIKYLEAQCNEDTESKVIIAPQGRVLEAYQGLIGTTITCY